MLRSSFDEGALLSPHSNPELLKLGQALTELAMLNACKARIVEMRHLSRKNRFLDGLSVEETAKALNVSQQTVLRDWNLSKVWLIRRMKPSKQ